MTSLVNENPIDEIAAIALEEYALVECKTEHFFVPGFYIRKCTMPAGSMVISCIHRQLHPFTVERGHCRVWTQGEGWKEYKGGDCGITTPGTQRVLVMLEETAWTTFQRSDKKTPEEVEQDLIEPHVNPFIPEEIQIAATKLCRGDVKYLNGEEKLV